MKTYYLLMTQPFSFQFILRKGRFAFPLLNLVGFKNLRGLAFDKKMAAGPLAFCGFKFYILRFFGSLFLPLALCLFAFCALAQQPTAASRTSRRVARDTTPLLFSFALAPERAYPSGDTLPNESFRQYNPTRRQAVDWGNLGNLGSAARPLFFDSPARRGFDLGYHSYDLYRLKANDLRFYRNTRTFSEVFFSQGRTQFDGTLNARFGRTFSGGANFSMDYRTINNKGQYRYQRDKHNALALGLWIPVGDRYDGFLIFCNNINRQQENGGILSDTVFGTGELAGPSAAEVRLPGQRAITRDADQTLQLTQHLKFTGLGDSSGSKRVFRATHTFAWSRERFKFSDVALDKDSNYFKPLFFTDTRGLRNYVQVNRVDNTLLLNTFKSKNKGRPSDVLSVGLRHSWFKLQQEPLADSSFSNLFATGDIAITPSERFAFTAQGDLGLLNNFLEYNLRGDLTLGLGRFGQLRGSLLSQRRPPSLLHQRLYVTQRLVWKNDFQKPVETTISATYALPWAGVELTARTHLVSNYLYFNQQGAAAQTTAAVQVQQFLATGNFRLGHFHLDNTVALQQTSRTDVLRLPTWFSRNSLYYSGKIFKKRLYFDAGTDFRTNAAFSPDAYQPLTNQFHLQDSLSQQPFIWLDLFASFKVQTFRFFFRYENIGTWWDKKSVLYHTAYHPQPFGGIRFGITWRFMDDNVEENPSAQPDGQQPGNDGSRPPAGPIGPTGRGGRGQ